MLQFQNIQKTYNSQVVLDIPLLQLEDGIYWLKGYNGSGKTTFLRMVAGLIPFKGDILYQSLNVKKDAVDYRKRIGWAEAEPLYPEFITGRELITLYSIHRKATSKQTEELLYLFDMTDYINNRVRTYSSGMLKKLAIVLAFLGNPSLVILDEPLITLDAESVTKLIHLINELNIKAGINFLLSSHVEPGAGQVIRHKQLQVTNRTVQPTA